MGAQRASSQSRGMGRWVSPNPHGTGDPVAGLKTNFTIATFAALLGGQSPIVGQATAEVKAALTVSGAADTFSFTTQLTAVCRPQIRTMKTIRVVMAKKTTRYGHAW
jgi:hypothetical protein